MTKSTITRELVHWLHDAATEFASTKLKMTMKPDEVLALTDALLASMDTEPVGWTDEAELRDVEKDGCGYLFKANPISPHADPRRVIKLYRHAQQPVVDADDNFYSWFGREWAENYQYNQYTTAAKQMLGVMAESAWKAGRRAAMLQAGALTNEDTRQVDELTMWIKRLVRSLKNANPDSKLPREAMDYLTAKGLISVGDILR